jgi:hypothetical protein
MISVKKYFLELKKKLLKIEIGADIIHVKQIGFTNYKRIKNDKKQL